MKSIEKSTGAKVDVINELNERVVVIRGDLASCEVRQSCENVLIPRSHGQQDTGQLALARADSLRVNTFKSSRAVLSRASLAHFPIVSQNGV